LLFEISLLERVLYELGNELDHRPDWVGIPLKDLKDILAAGGAAEGDEHTLVRTG
jgi:maltose alpha-D-glucosyltransferase/alpha-amylase